MSNSVSAPRPHPWYPLRWWDFAVGSVIALLTGIGVMTSPFSGLPVLVAPGAGITAVACVLAAFVVNYLLLGRAALQRSIRNMAPLPVDLWFLALMVVLTGIATSVNASFATLQVLGYPLIWSCIPRYRNAVVWSGLLALAVAMGGLVQGDMFGNRAGAVVMATMSFVFALAMGTWITKIFNRGEEQRRLAEQLGVSQREIAVLSAETGAAAERERLSRELHDTLTQTLTGMVMLSEQAERALAAGDTGLVQDRLGRVHSAALDSLAEARALVATTQPLGDGGLEAAIERVAARLRVDAGLEVSCAISPLALDRERQVILLRAVQEGLANARKHARASTVHVVLESEAGLGSEGQFAVLRIEDDGVGPAGGAAGPSGFGLTGMADRLRAIGGEVRFGAGAHGGATLKVRLPMAAASVAPTPGSTSGQKGAL